MSLSKVASLQLLGVLSIALAITLVAIHIPAQIYGANEPDFAFPLTTLLSVSLPWVALAVVLLSLPLLTGNRALLRIIAAFWFCLCISIWISTSFLILDVGVLDGRTEIVVPASHVALTVVTLLSAAFASALAAYRAPGKCLLAVAALSIAQLGGSLFHIARTAPGETRGADADPAAVADLYRLSDQKNVLIIVIDTFQSTLFEDYLQKAPDVYEDLDGFTFFRNTTGSAPTTYASMPPIHSGVMFEPERSLSSAYEELVQSGSFVAQLAQAGYRASMVNAIRSCPEGAQCLEDQLIMNDDESAAAYEYLQLLDVSLLRAAPAGLKRWVFNDGSWRTRRWIGDQQMQARPIRNHRFLTRFIDRIHVSEGSPAVKFLHLFHVHPPIEISDTCEPLLETLPLTRENFGLPASCAVETVIRLLARLKTLGVYDNSFIAVIADHGARLRPVPRSNEIVGAAMPLLLVKPPSARGPMQVSDRPAEIRDIAATVCKETGDCRSLGGAPLDELPASRRRSYFHYLWRHEFWSSDRIEAVSEYEINGLVWQPTSWARLQPPLPRLPTDETVPINDGFPSRAGYLDWGWSILESWGVWSDGPSASLSFSCTAAAQRSTDLVLDTMLFVRPESPALSVSLTANGHAVKSWRFEYPQTEATLRARLEPEMWGRDDRMTIELHFERDIPLESLPEPPSRMLGVGIRSVRLESAATTKD